MQAMLRWKVTFSVYRLPKGFGKMEKVTIVNLNYTLQI